MSEWPFRLSAFLLRGSFVEFFSRLWITLDLISVVRRFAKGSPKAKYRAKVILVRVIVAFCSHGDFRTSFSALRIDPELPGALNKI